MFRVKSLVLSASFLLATALTPTAVYAAGGVAAKAPASKVVTTGSCTVKKADFAASTLDGSSTTSTTHVNIPEGAVSFTQGGNNSGCVIVNFSGMSFAATASTALVYVRALLDGVTVSIPAETQFSGDDDEDADGRWSRSHDYNFVFPSVAPGLHTIQMQFRSLDGGAVFMNRHTTVVYHR